VGDAVAGRELDVPDLLGADPRRERDVERAALAEDAEVGRLRRVMIAAPFTETTWSPAARPALATSEFASTVWTLSS